MLIFIIIITGGRMKRKGERKEKERRKGQNKLYSIKEEGK